MDDRRQKNQLELAWGEEVKGEARKLILPGTESSAAKRGTESPAITEALMEEVCERETAARLTNESKQRKEVLESDGRLFASRHGPSGLPAVCAARLRLSRYSTTAWGSTVTY